MSIWLTPLAEVLILVLMDNQNTLFGTFSDYVCFVLILVLMDNQNTLPEAPAEKPEIPS